MSDETATGSTPPREPPTPVASYESTTGKPIVLRIERVSGEWYEVTLAPIVAAIADKHEQLNGMPQFEIMLHFVINTRRV